MNAAEVKGCLEYLLARSPQTKIEAATVKAWEDDFSRWSSGVAMEAIRRATAEKPFVGIAEITKHVRQVRQEQINAQHIAEQFEDAHCRIHGCPCNHDDCYRGWSPSTKFEGAFVPCRTCKPDLARVLNTMPDPGARGVGGFVPVYDRNKSKESK